MHEQKRQTFIGCGITGPNDWMKMGYVVAIFINQ